MYIDAAGFEISADVKCRFNTDCVFFVSYYVFFIYDNILLVSNFR